MTRLTVLAGAGCASPRWLAREAEEYLKIASRVVYDRLIHPDILQLAPDACEFYAAGKRVGDHTMEQAEINALLVELGRRDGVTVRLKGGDPFVFGRGGEEAEALAEAGVPWIVVPGVTSALAGALACGVPVTHRRVSSAVTLATGHFHLDDQKFIDSLAKTDGTLALYMGASRFAELAPMLIERGRSAGEPAMAIRWGGWGRAAVTRGTLASLARLAREGKIKSPSIIYVGGVASLALEPAEGALAGMQVAVCRPYPAGWDTARELERHGADAYSVPLLAMERLSPEDAEATLGLLARADWVVLTSPRGAAELLRVAGDLRRIRGKIAAIGEATANAARAVGLEPELTAEQPDSHGLAASLCARVKPGELVVFARNERGSHVAVRAVRERGATAASVPTYRMAARAVPGLEVMQEQWNDCGLDAIAFGSSAMVEAWRDAVGTPPEGTALIAWGKICAETIERTWNRPAATMPTPDTSGLIAALKQ